MDRFNRLIIDTLVNEALDYAERKHPEFCEAFTKKSMDAVISKLAEYRSANTGVQVVDNVLKEELYEFFEAYMNHDHKNAVMELAQCCQVLLRAFNMLLNEIPIRDRVEIAISLDGKKA